MKKKVILIGANGQLGTDLQRVSEQNDQYTIIPLTHKDIEIASPHEIERTFEQIPADVVINCAANNRVNEIEQHAFRAFGVNALANKNLAYHCSNRNIVYVYISTDYVFGSDSKRTTPYTEFDCPGPVNSYGISKLAGEYFTQYNTSKYFILRTSGLYGLVGSTSKGTNFVEMILQKGKEQGHVRVVNDQVVSPTYTVDLAKQLLQLLESDMYGLYHATAEGSCTWYEFTKEIYKLTNTNATIEAVTSDAFKTTANRPKYSVLDNSQLKKLGINSMRPWKEGLKDYLKEKGYTIDD